MGESLLVLSTGRERIALVSTPEGFSSLQQCSDLVIGIEVGLSAFGPVGQQTERRKFGRGIRRTPVPGEAADDAETCRPLTGCVVGMLCCPLQCQIDGNARAAFSFQE